MTELYLIAAFAERPFTGNPAAVVLREQEADTGWMTNIARELNQPATAFCWPEGDGFRLRWFAPAKELEICGHATLATAHALRLSGRDLSPRHRFHTRGGELAAMHLDEGAIQLDFPLRPPVPQRASPELLSALGATPLWSGSNGMDWLIEVETENAVRALAPHLTRLARIPARAAMVTARASRPDADFVSRFFAPSIGIDEDQVTGSAHCALLPYWADKLGREALVGYQMSPRGGFVRVRREDGRAKLIGNAYLTARGQIEE